MKPRVVQHIILLAVGLLFLSACKPKVPKEYIQPDEMEDLLYDYYVAQTKRLREAHQKGSLGQLCRKCNKDIKWKGLYGLYIYF